jgi:microcystin-dependent protein
MKPVPESASGRRRFLARLATLTAGLVLPWRARMIEAAPQETAAYDGFLGEIMLIAGTYPPKGWAFCNGQLLSIAQNQALYSLLGNTYGGNGQTTFALPDFRARVVMHQGQGPGLSPRPMGERAGVVGHTLLATEIPAHTHVARAASASGTVVTPGNTVVPARSAASIPQWGTTADAALAPGAMTSAGGSQAHTNEQPYLVLNYVIALQGQFPS